MHTTRTTAAPAGTQFPERGLAPSSSSAFDVELGNAMRMGQAVALALMEKHPAACLALAAIPLSEVLLKAVKSGYGDVVRLLAAQTTPAQRMAIPPDRMLELVEAACLLRGSEPETVALLNALFRDVPDSQAQLDNLAEDAQSEGKTLLASALCSYKAECKLGNDHQYSQAQQNIYQAALAGDAAQLQNLLDDELGIPRQDDALVGFPWLLNALHRWIKGVIAESNARVLVNTPAGPMTLLQAAVASGDARTVEVLLEKGADASISDGWGCNVLMAQAVQTRNLAVAILLRKHGAGEFQEAAMNLALPGPVAAGPGPALSGTGHEDTISEQFRQLLPGAASLLNRSGDMAMALNSGKDMGPQQVQMLWAGFLAGFDPFSLRNMDDEEAAVSNEAATMAALLRHNRNKLVAEGKRLEASMGAEIARGLDGLFDEFADATTYERDSVGRSLSDAGLCSLLIARVTAALETARDSARWGSAGAGAGERKQLFINALRVQLGHRNTAAGYQAASLLSGDPELFGNLLQSQVAMLGSYCATAAVQAAPVAATVYDFA